MPAMPFITDELVAMMMPVVLMAHPARYLAVRLKLHLQSGLLGWMAYSPMVSTRSEVKEWSLRRDIK
jgi:hypothetical protein